MRWMAGGWHWWGLRGLKAVRVALVGGEGCASVPVHMFVHFVFTLD